MFVPDSELNADLCLSSGQVFRFKRMDAGWIGADGKNIIRCNRAVGGWEIASSPDEGAAARFFQLHLNSDEINAEIHRSAKELRPFIKRHRGLRLLRQAAPHETTFSFICSANNNISRITRMVNFIGDQGHALEMDVHEFPTIEQVSRNSELELREAGFGYRAAIIPEVARQLLIKPEQWLNSLAAAPYDEAHQALMELRGVGPKVADCVCLVGLGHTSAVPIDTHLWSAATELYFPEWKGKPITDVRYRAVGNLFRDKFGPLAGWAHQYLFYDRVLAHRGGNSHSK